LLPTLQNNNGNKQQHHHENIIMKTSSSLTFPITAFTKITGKPDFYSLQQLRAQSHQNAMAIASTRGGGTHGHLGAFMPTAEYAPISNNNVA